MSPPQDQAEKLEFELVVSHLTETHKAFIENTGKVAGFLLLALGWFATSGDARGFLASKPQLAQLSALAVASAYVLSVTASWVAFRNSERGVRRLGELGYLPPSAYEARVLRPMTFWVCVGGSGVLAMLLVAALLTVT